MILIGVISILIAALFCALYCKVNESLSVYTLGTRLFWQFSIGLLVVLALFRNVNLEVVQSITPNGWLMISLLALVVSIGGYGFWILSINKIGATVNGAIDYIEPLVGILLAMIIFGESMSISQLFGWGLIMFTLFNIKKLTYE